MSIVIPVSSVAIDSARVEVRMSETYDLIIIGGGSAGLTAAGLAVQFEARVALVEKGRIGRASIASRCVVHRRSTLRASSTSVRASARERW